MTQATTLKPGQIRHLLRVTEATSRHPERDCLILLLGLTCGVRVSEIAQIEIQDIMFSSGVLRSEVSLRRASITKGCRQRCIYITHQKTIENLERYLGLRIERGLGTELSNEKFRGLSPQTTLILTHKGSKFYLNTKRRTNFAGEHVDYLACHSSRISQKCIGTLAFARAVVTDLFLQATYYPKVRDSGTVQQLMGHAELSC